MQNKGIGGEKSVNEKNVEVFNRYFPGCLSVENDNKLTLDVGRLKALLGDFSEIKEEGYGLDFVGKKIALNQAFKKNNKILKPLNESTSKHILIKGDNLDALKILRQSYSEKIKMIYIDPPYNTKNDNFIYSDDFSQSNEEVLKTLDYSKEKLDYIKNLFGSKCHSGWLSFMYPRLLLAKDLLKQDGVIFISIDDNEAAQLKLLCDEIFGEGNFVCNFIWKCRTSKQYSSVTASIQTDYILCYGKNKNMLLFNKVWGENDGLGYKNLDNDPKGAWITSGLIRDDGRKKYKIITPSGKEYYEAWLYTEENMKKFRENGELWFGIDGDAKPRKKSYLKDFEGNVTSNLLIGSEIGTNEYGTNEVKGFFQNQPIFNNPKPTKLIKYLLQISTTPNEGDIILDFFAGSGTTAHAVLESNKSDYQKLSEGGGVI